MLSPFRDFWYVQNEFDRTFNDMVRNSLGTRREGMQQLWAPRLEAFAK